MTDEERSQVFDAHEKLRKAFNRWEREPGAANARFDVKQALIGLQKLDAQLLANMARALKKKHEPQPVPERFWWKRD
jgi:3-methyladenine DNA glycosylase AlkC